MSKLNKKVKQGVDAHAKEVQRQKKTPWLYNVVFRRNKEGQLMYEGGKEIDVNDGNGAIVKKRIPQIDRKASKWVFNAKLKALGYRPKQFMDVKPSKDAQKHEEFNLLGVTAKAK